MALILGFRRRESRARGLAQAEGRARDTTRGRYGPLLVRKHSGSDFRLMLGAEYFFAYLPVRVL
jgi:hypothetical protein